MIKVLCPNCRNHFFTPPKAAGKSGKCPACGEILRVPFPQEELLTGATAAGDAVSSPEPKRPLRESKPRAETKSVASETFDAPASNGNNHDKNTHPSLMRYVNWLLGGDDPGGKS